METRSNLKEVLAASRRAADRALSSTVESADTQMAITNNDGRLWSSSHLRDQARIFEHGFENICTNATRRAGQLASGDAGLFKKPLAELLAEYRARIYAEFTSRISSPHRSPFVLKEEQDAIAELGAKLDALLIDGLTDFELMIRRNPTLETAPLGRESVGYAAAVLKVMIASPSDVGPERAIIRDVIHEWNAIHSEDRSIVLLPVGWETHSSPALGAHPQEIINRQVLANCDLLIAVFWTKLGTPTGRAESGTAEEIDEHIKAGKPALLYFSSEPVVMESVDLDQYRALKEFEKAKLQEGLIERYETKAEFRQKVARQLTQTIIREFERSEERSPSEVESLVERATTWPARTTLGPGAKELLIEAASDKDGIIMRVEFVGGSEVQTNRRQFITSPDPRTVALWRDAVVELENAGYIEDRTGKGEVYFMTTEGYLEADRLSQGR